jgi:hypothetical protein
MINDPAFSAYVCKKIYRRPEQNLHTCATKFSHSVSVASIRVEIYFHTYGNLRRYLRRFTSARMKIYAGTYVGELHAHNTRDGVPGMLNIPINWDCGCRRPVLHLQITGSLLNPGF